MFERSDLQLSFRKKKKKSNSLFSGSSQVDLLSGELHSVTLFDAGWGRHGRVGMCWADLRLCCFIWFVFRKVQVDLLFPVFSAAIVVVGGGGMRVCRGRRWWWCVCI